MGSLRDCDYSLNRAWTSSAARRVRKKFTAERCSCLQSNAAYTNAVFYLPTLTHIGWNYFGNIIFNGIKDRMVRSKM
ncbi:MAG: hypothetical protein AB1546_08400, partial [bacterium]